MRKTATINIRVLEPLKEELTLLAAAKGEELTTFIIPALIRQVHEHGDTFKFAAASLLSDMDETAKLFQSKELTSAQFDFLQALKESLFALRKLQNML